MAVLSIAPEARVVMTCDHCAWWHDVTELPSWGRTPARGQAYSLPVTHYIGSHDPGPWPTFRLRGIDTIALYLPGTASRHIPPFTVVNGVRFVNDRALIHEKYVWHPGTNEFRERKW